MHKIFEIDGTGLQVAWFPKWFRAHRPFFDIFPPGCPRRPWMLPRSFKNAPKMVSRRSMPRLSTSPFVDVSFHTWAVSINKNSHLLFWSNMLIFLSQSLRTAHSRADVDFISTWMARAANALLVLLVQASIHASRTSPCTATTGVCLRLRSASSHAHRTRSRACVFV